MRYLTLLLTGLTLLSFASCGGTDSETSPSGVEVIYIKRGEGPKPKPGELLMINMEYKDTKGRELFNSVKNGQGAIPLRYEGDSIPPPSEVYEVFNMLGKGDSVKFNIETRALFEKTFESSVPDSLKDEKHITFWVGVEDVTTEEAFNKKMMERYEKEQAQLNEEIESKGKEDREKIADFLSENNINAEVDESGIHYVVESAGSGKKPEAGDKVTVHYTGYLLDGEKFDSSVDRGEPFSFTIGRGEVIQGWDKGIALFAKGGKGTLYIPSDLAYQNRAMGKAIPAFSILKFDIELINIEKP